MQGFDSLLFLLATYGNSRHYTSLGIRSARAWSKRRKSYPRKRETSTTQRPPSHPMWQPKAKTPLVYHCPEILLLDPGNRFWTPSDREMIEFQRGQQKYDIIPTGETEKS